MVKNAHRSIPGRIAEERDFGEDDVVGIGFPARRAEHDSGVTGEIANGGIDLTEAMRMFSFTVSAGSVAVRA